MNQTALQNILPDVHTARLECHYCSFKIMKAISHQAPTEARSFASQELIQQMVDHQTKEHRGEVIAL